MSSIESYLVEGKLPEMQLHVWRGEGQLQTVDFKCLQWLTFCKIVKLPIKVKYTWETAVFDNSLPFIQCGSKRITKIATLLQIVNFHQKNENIHSGDSNVQPIDDLNFDTLAYASFIDTKLYPVSLYIWFGNETNYDQVIRSVFSRRCPFPFGNWTPPRLHQRHLTFLNLVFPNRKIDPWFELRLLEECREWFATLDARLDKNEYFGGKSPNLIDALVFGCLAPLYYVSLPACIHALEGLKELTSLVRFIDRMKNRFYPELASNAENPKIVHNSNELSDSISWPEVILSGVIVVSAMAFYGISQGIIQFSNEDETNEKDDELDSDYKSSAPILDIADDLLLPTPDSSDQTDESEQHNENTNENEFDNSTKSE